MKSPVFEYDDDEGGIDDVFDEEYNFYTEKSTNLIYEAKFFDNFVIARPASPAFYSAIRKMGYAEFTAEFQEFWGDREQVRSYIDRVADGIIIE